MNNMDGYKLLNIGDVIRPGDEYQDMHNSWKPIYFSFGDAIKKHWATCRRPIKKKKKKIG